MIGMKMGEDDVANVVLAKPQSNQTRGDAAAEIVDEAQIPKLQEGRRRGTPGLELAGSGTEENESIGHTPSVPEARSRRMNLDKLGRKSNR